MTIKPYLPIYFCGKAVKFPRRDRVHGLNLFYNVFMCSFWSTLLYFVRRYVLTEINLRRNKQRELISFAEILAFWLCQVPTVPC